MYFFLVELEPENLLLPTDSLATVIKISMSCLADSDCSKQVANLSMIWITLLPAPIFLAVFVTMQVPTRVSVLFALVLGLFALFLMYVSSLIFLRAFILSSVYFLPQGCISKFHSPIVTVIWEDSCLHLLT